MNAAESTEAQLAAAKLQTSQLKTQASGTGADIVGEQANLAIKRNALGRQQALLKKGFTTRADYEDALNEVRTAEQDLADRYRPCGAVLRQRCERLVAQALQIFRPGHRAGGRTGRTVCGPWHRRGCHGVLVGAQVTGQAVFDNLRRRAVRERQHRRSRG